MKLHGSRLRRFGWAVAVSAVLGGCSGRGTLSLTGSTEMDFSGRFETAVFGVEGRQSLHVVMLAGPADDPQQVLHLQMFFVPEAGRTPMDEHATNTAVRYVVFTETGVGVYGGAGLMTPGFQFNSSMLNATLRNANLRLLDASTDYEPTLVLPWADGTIRATRDDARTMALLQQVQRKLAERLGYPRFVRAE